MYHHFESTNPEFIEHGHRAECTVNFRIFLRTKERGLKKHKNCWASIWRRHEGRRREFEGPTRSSVEGCDLFYVTI